MANTKYKMQAVFVIITIRGVEVRIKLAPVEPSGYEVSYNLPPSDQWVPLEGVFESVKKGVQAAADAADVFVPKARKPV